jgi:hypothetical protein
MPQWTVSDEAGFTSKNLGDYKWGVDEFRLPSRKNFLFRGNQSTQHACCGTILHVFWLYPYTVNPVMSPLEALYVTHFLIMQKQINQSSQITPAERAELKARVKRLEEEGFRLTQPERGEVMRALIEQKLDPEKPQVTAEELARRVQQQRAEGARTFLIGRRSTVRDVEMQDVFRRAYRMKVGDAIALANRSLDLLGIDN